ncbi:unnamed protein product [Clonostachys rosea]|uniref:Uncharacterized protein n=1 Tax=Bionectria ochroleuca TaxID=29856 RepID=A0ABY6U123_BIOOC|nr:unnamed protein product [Clonostachys rosea]
MPEIPIDRAINISFEAYDTGKPQRVEERVIPVRRGGGESTKNAKKTSEIVDESDAGQSFSFKETTDVEAAELKKLVVVVGEHIPESVKKKSNEAKGKKNTLSFGQVLAEPIKTKEAKDVRIVVRRMADAKNNFFVLVKRGADGLCGLSALPSRDSVFYYPEWLEGNNGLSTHAQKRKNIWSENITRFCQEYIMLNAETVGGAQEYIEKRSPSKPVKTLSGMQILISDLKKSSACHLYTKDTEHLTHMLSQLQKATSQCEKANGASNLWSTTKNFITGKKLMH